MLAPRAVTIRLVAHHDQRYPTCGDWAISGQDLVITVSRTPDERMAWVVAVHELVEALLCMAHGITQAQVDAWDRAYKPSQGEPGEDPHSPYWREHGVAAGVEYALLAAYGIAMADYHAVLEDL